MTLYTLDIKKTSIKYLIISVLCLMVSCIYEYFSHEVYSSYMMAPFLVVFVAGILIVPLIKRLFTKAAFYLYNFSLATLVVGMYVQGVLEIYGTTNSLVYYYFIAAVVFFIESVIAMFVRGK